VNGSVLTTATSAFGTGLAERQQRDYDSLLGNGGIDLIRIATVCWLGRLNSASSHYCMNVGCGATLMSAISIGRDSAYPLTGWDERPRLRRSLK